MKSRIVLATVAAALMIVASLYAEEKLEGVKCIISGQPVKADKTIDYKKGKVYFCCENCPKTFDAAKHGTKANHQLVLTGQFVQKACPLTGKDTDESTALKVNGVEVVFCCNNCKGAVSKAEADKQGEMVFADKAFDKAFELKKAEKE
jgi:YHS domain-containing protein